MSSARIVAPIAAAALIATSGLLHAVQTGAWGRQERLDAAAARVNRADFRVAGWRGSDRELDPDQMRAAQAAGAFTKTFSRDNGDDVSVMLLCGPAAPIAVHPPTVCFVSAGYEQVTPEKRVRVTRPDGHVLGTFWVADFERSQDSAPIRIRTYWGWSDGRGWQAPESARFAFAGTEILHKLYVTRVVASPNEAEPIDAFLKSFIPELDRALFSVRS